MSDPNLGKTICFDYSHNNNLTIESPSYADFVQYLFGSVITSYSIHYTKLYEGEYKIRTYLKAEDSPPKGGVILYSPYGVKTQVTLRAAYQLPASW